MSRHAKYHEKNREKRNEYSRAYYYRHRNKLLEEKRQYHIDNKDEINKKTRIRWSENKELMKEARLKKKFGITNEQYNLMLEEQDGVCAICLQPPKTVRLAVDHDHETGIIRGLLCKDCNTALGFLKDNLNALEMAIKYLKKFGK